MTKNVKHTISIILTDPGKPGQFLIVKRPSEDADLGGCLGFPSVTLQPGEFPVEAARRVAVEKLSCEAVPTRFLGTMFQRRNSYDLFLSDIEMRLDGGKQPDVIKSNTKVTKYTDQKWTSDPMELMPAAIKGSCCASIFLTDCGMLDRSEWIASLEGSILVA